MNTKTIHYLTQEELKQLLTQVASKRDKAFILLAYPYGLRASEVGLLRREDIDFDRLKIRITRLKGSISSEYPLRPEVAQALNLASTVVGRRNAVKHVEIRIVDNGALKACDYSSGGARRFFLDSSSC